MNLKNKLKNIKNIYGSWLSLNNFQLCEILSNLNVEFIGIDLEHTPTTIEQFYCSTSTQVQPFYCTLSARVLKGCYEN